jgi:hypothetical protein
MAHDDACLCYECLNHNNCIPLLNPRWICLIPQKINEILIGPLDHLQADCLFEVKESKNNSFHILTQYAYPNFITGMITITIITPTPYVIKPGELLASMCTVTIENVIEEFQGNIFLYLFFSSLTILSSLTIFVYFRSKENRLLRHLLFRH